IGSWSMQPSTTARYFQQLMSWGGAGNSYTGPNSPPADHTAAADGFHIHFGVFAAATPTTIAFQVPGPEFLNLTIGHWYRVKSRWSFTASQVLSVSIQDLTAGTPAASYDVTGLGWYLQGGPTSTMPLPTDMRVFAGGVGDISGWDNIDVHKVVVPTCYANCD